LSVTLVFMAPHRSEPAEYARLAMRDLHEAGVIDDAQMRRFNVKTLDRQPPLSPSAIRAIRRQAGLSQALFATALNVPVSLVSQWERGEKKPSGPSLKLLDLVKSKGIDVLL
jgi:putative transcriptional regulator